MAVDSKSLLGEYIKAIEKELVAGNATEPSHYPALKALIEGLTSGVTATNNPKHIECGAPDFMVTKGFVTIGYIEAKDIGKSLDDAEKSEQLKRYRESLSNLILTDYLEFRWYVDGERRVAARLGTQTEGGVIKKDKAGLEPIAELLDGFLSRKAEAVGTPKELALHMAKLAHMIRNLIVNAFAKEPETGSLHNQLSAFRDNLIPDLSAEQFADMYAQTIAYGLFAARCTNPGSKDFTRKDAAFLLPKTNPFLRKLFNHIAGPDLDDRIAWLVDDLAQVLAQADMAAVLKDFGKHTAKEDPVVHFYETFLTAYDPKVREMRGVYYTPEPVVSYIVRSIDYLLKTRFNKPQGLADHETLILDPAVGTATFLYMAINEIYQAIIAKGQQGLWNEYVKEKLLPRIFGFELLMAPYAVAHLKLGLLLQETGYKFQTDQRLGIYLTNTLEEAFKKSERLAGFNEYIVDEANAAAEIKKGKPIMVVLGNPPYSGISANASVRMVPNPKTGKPRKELTWIGRLIEDYKMIDGKPLGERKHWLQDDYVKFIRFGQWRINRTGSGVLAFITNHGYLDNPTFRGMRQSIMKDFTDIFIVNLHGNVKKKEISPDGSKDENIFDIQQGVAIGIFVKEKGKEPCRKIHHADLWGFREGKYETLSETNIENSGWAELTPTSPSYSFVPHEEEFRAEYEKGWKITELFLLGRSGIITARDKFVVDFEPVSTKKRLELFLDKDLSDSEVKEKLSLSENYMWRVSEARKQLMQVKDWEAFFNRILYRPFDIRSIYYHTSVVWRTRRELMRHVLAGKNLVLVMSGQTKDPFGAFVTDQLAAHKAVARYDVNYAFPLYIYPSEGEMQLESGKRRPNLSPDFIKASSEKLGLKFIGDGKGNLTDTFGPEDVFNYAYAVFHSPAYRTRYAEFLKMDFPRLPLTSDKESFKALTAKGAELTALHLMQSPTLNNLITTYPVAGSHKIERVTHDANNQRIYINKTQYFDGVPPEVWNFHIGGYQVCEKWLKDRKGRKLSLNEADHYQKIIVALKETIRLMAEIDALIPSWPLE